MLKRSPFLLAALALILTACAGQPAATPTVAPTATATTAAATASSEAVADCTVVSFIPTPDPTEASLFPAPSADDHVLGPDTAAVTFMEYSDFQ